MAPNVAAHIDGLSNSDASSSFLLHLQPSTDATPTPTPTPTPPPSHHDQQPHPCHMQSSQLVAHDQCNLITQAELPVVDLGLLCHADEAAEMQKLVMAVKEWGFFEVANSCVPLKLLSEIEEQVSHVFALPFEAKIRSEPAAGSFHGYLARSSGEDGKMLQLSEALRLPLNPQHRSDMIIQLWPEGNEAFSSVVEEYIAAVETILLQLLKSLALGLGLDPLQFTHNLSNDANFSTLRMNIYNDSSQLSPTDLGLVAHSDASLLTILHQSSVDGLQIRKDDKWIAIKPRLGFFVVNVGDMLQVMTNDLLLSVVHRVVKTSNKCRSSVVFIKVTHPQFIVRPIPQLVSEQRPSQYLPFTADEYYTSMSSNRLLDGKSNLDRFRISPTLA